MKLLPDAKLSPKPVDRLRDAGYHASHVGGLGMVSASDEAIFARAAQDGWTVLAADTHLSTLHTTRYLASFRLLLRHIAELTCIAHADLLIASLGKLATSTVARRATVDP